MLSLLEQTQKLIDAERKQSFFIAKELAIIEVNLIWYPEKRNDHIARLRSLAQHVGITFPGNSDAKDLMASIKHRALTLGTQVE